MIILFPDEPPSLVLHPPLVNVTLSLKLSVRVLGMSFSPPGPAVGRDQRLAAGRVECGEPRRWPRVRGQVRAAPRAGQAGVVPGAREAGGVDPGGPGGGVGGGGYHDPGAGHIKPLGDPLPGVLQPGCLQVQGDQGKEGTDRFREREREKDAFKFRLATTFRAFKPFYFIFKRPFYIYRSKEFIVVVGYYKI